MRRRVLLATVSAVAVAVILLGLPLAILGANLVRDNEIRDLQARTSELGRSVEGRLTRGEAIDEAFLDRYVGGENGRIAAYIQVVSPDGTNLSAGNPIAGKVVERPILTQSNATIQVAVSYWDIYLRSAQVVMLVIAAAVVAFGAGIVTAVWQANRLSAPLVYLAASAEQLGSGQVRPRIEPSGVEEIDLVAAELARSSDRMAGRLAAERQFASDASHQLRTPLTALSMRLEEISLAAGDNEEVQEEARISLEQVERLVQVVDDLLTRSRTSGGTTEAVHLIEVVQQQEEEWAPTFLKHNRKLVIDVSPDAHVLATPGALAQVLATLIENSLKHGAGTTTVHSKPSGPSGAMAIQVSDEGPGVPDDLAPRIFEREVTSGRGTGLGLALARDLVAADGGRLELSQRRPPVFSVFLAGVPRTMDPELVLPRGAPISSRSKRRRSW
ncbi:Signal transduction histidine kinase [Sanguibacter gelidistatuariae]|uniref:Signal transduction histidine-protein kinase/phosphatase MprB n=1 Tax=Sanguibacter gelidistatuariae TaxID=1814289 RepID=A0A1G6QMH9_9MICO|nr:ATP-binding protein [Sanguibacter gelidistatuariae]SDC93513.1 Signal transduction histidine kinase [Sanguibacter gelidistatuariae]